MVNPVGFEFRPTDEEIVDHYLRIKNLNSNTSDVDHVINTVDICNFDPWQLPSQSKLTSKDQVWYFFGRKENKYNKGDRQSRKTKSGFWKKTGVTMDVSRKRGTREKIGEKMVLVFQSSKKNQSVTKSDWVMHEYHGTCLPPKMITYKICKVEFKGEEKDISSCYYGGEAEHNHSLIPPIENSAGLSLGSEVKGWPHSQELVNPRLFTDYLDEQKETQLGDAIGRAFDARSEDLKRWLDSEIVSMQEDCSDYRPKKSLTGVFTGHSSDDSDSDLISVTTVSTTFQSSINTSSACTSFSSSNRRMDQIKDVQESPNSTTIKFVSLTPKVSQLLGQESEIGETKLDQEIIKKKKAGYFYKIIQRFVKRIHLCSSVSRT